MKFQLVIQHDFQKVAYLEFRANDHDTAVEIAEDMLKEYKSKPFFSPNGINVTGNFAGIKPRIVSTWISEWVPSPTAVNGWGALSGGYWKSLKGYERKP